MLDEDLGADGDEDKATNQLGSFLEQAAQQASLDRKLKIWIPF